MSLCYNNDVFVMIQLNNIFNGLTLYKATFL